MLLLKRSLLLIQIIIMSKAVIASKLDKKACESVGPIYKDLKFGVMVKNDLYQIYRAKNLGTDGLEDLQEFTGENQLPFPKTIISMNFFGYKFPFYSSMEEYKLKAKYGYTFYHSYGHGIRTYLDGHNPYAPKDDIDTKSKLGSEARKIFELRNDGIDGGIDTFFTIMKIVLDPNNQPVLFHCFGGRHRTGMIAMALRYIQGGKWTDKIVAKKKGILMNLAQYEYYKFNRSMFRKENIEFIEKVKNDPRFVELKLQYQDLIK